MDKVKGYFPPALLENDMNSKNRIYYNEMISNPDVLKNYHQIYDKLFRYTKNVDCEFENYTPQMISDFVDQYVNVGASWKNTVITAIKVMRNILTINYSETFPSNFLFGIQRYSDENKNFSGHDYLSPEELLTIKEQILKMKMNFKSRLVFSALYYDGLDKQYFDMLYDEKALVGSILTVNDKKGKTIQFEISSETLNALNEIKGIYTPIMSSGILEILKYITQRLAYYGFEERKVLKTTHIYQTRERNFFKCPICDKLRENIPSNWVVIKRDGFDEMSIVCSACKGGRDSE